MRGFGDISEADFQIGEAILSRSPRQWEREIMSDEIAKPRNDWLS
jgi:hypothetical protein